MGERLVRLGQPIAFTKRAITQLPFCFHRCSAMGRPSPPYSPSTAARRIFRRGRAGAGINVNIVHIAGRIIVPSAGTVRQARGVELLDVIGDFNGFELAPNLR